MRTLGQSQTRAFPVALGSLLERLAGGRGLKEGRDERLTVAFAEAHGVMRADRLDGRLLRARNDEIRQRTALKLRRAEEKILLLRAGTRS